MHRVSKLEKKKLLTIFSFLRFNNVKAGRQLRDKPPTTSYIYFMIGRLESKLMIFKNPGGLP